MAGPRAGGVKGWQGCSPSLGSHPLQPSARTRGAQPTPALGNSAPPPRQGRDGWRRLQPHPIHTLWWAHYVSPTQEGWMSPPLPLPSGWARPQRSQAHTPPRSKRSLSTSTCDLLGASHRRPPHLYALPPPRFQFWQPQSYFQILKGAAGERLSFRVNQGLKETGRGAKAQTGPRL